jgi:hypothetical protein
MEASRVNAADYITNSPAAMAKCGQSEALIARLLHAIEAMNAGQLKWRVSATRRARDRYSTMTGFSLAGMRETLPVATSIWAVVITLWARSTRGMQPRISCAARRPETTTNSNGFVPWGR